MLTRLAARDIRTNLGSNLVQIKCKSGQDPWLYGGKRKRDELQKYNESTVPKNDNWRISYSQQLLAMKLEMFYAGAKDGIQVDDLINQLVIK